MARPFLFHQEPRTECLLILVTNFLTCCCNCAGREPRILLVGPIPSSTTAGTQLPVMHALATEFVVCDNWHASMPGPTWPNRMFIHAASSSGLDHSPSIAEIADWEALAGFSFQNGTIFDALREKGITRRLYGGDDFPMVSAL